MKIFISDRTLSVFWKNLLNNVCKQYKSTGEILQQFPWVPWRMFWRNPWKTSWRYLEKPLEEYLEEYVIQLPKVLVHKNPRSSGEITEGKPVEAKKILKNFFKKSLNKFPKKYVFEEIFQRISGRTEKPSAGIHKNIFMLTNKFWSSFCWNG